MASGSKTSNQTTHRGKPMPKVKHSKLFRDVAERLLICYVVPGGGHFRRRMQEWVTWVDGRQPKGRPTKPEWRKLVDKTAEAIAQSEKWKRHPEMGRCWEDRYDDPPDGRRKTPRDQH
jgi:hypothetical protein